MAQAVAAAAQGDRNLARLPPGRTRDLSRTSWANVERVLFWPLALVAIAALVILGALLTGHLAEDSTRTAAPVNFSIAVAPARARVTEGGNARYTVSLRAPAGFSDDVRLSMSGATGRFARDLLRPPASTVLTVTTSRRTLPGTYPIRVTARTESRVGRVRVLLVVTPS